MDFIIEDIKKKDFEDIINLNKKFITVLNDLTLKDLIYFKKISPYFKTLKIGDKFEGFIITLFPNCNYKSENYIWFNSRFKSFIYIDRICISNKQQQKGYGFAIYKDLLKNIKKKVKRITCEVNLIPENFISNRFHKKFGFEEIGTQYIDNKKKMVSLKEYVLN